MGYSEALEAAGAEVLKSEYFGSYQGDAIFQVALNGTKGWIVISYGSCSWCDAFEAEFGYSSDERNTPEFKQRLADFGKDYLECIMTTEQILKRYEGDRKWDMGAQDIIDYVKSNPV